MPARRAVARWAWRLFRREWRQQALVLALLTLAIAAVMAGTTAAYNVLPSHADKFGSADLRLDFTAPDAATAQRGIAAVRRAWHTADAIASQSVAVPGSVETIALRAQDPHGPYGAGMLSLRAGRYPTNARDIAVTRRAADLFHAGLGRSVTINGVRRNVVGVVENPADLNDTFALVSELPAARSETVAVLVRAGTGPNPSDPGRNCAACRSIAGLQFEMRGTADNKAGAALVLAMSTVALLLVGLVASAGFVVVAQRRTRQLGMLAAIGATPRQLRLVMLVNGATVGIVAALVGAALALAGWIGLAPTLETAAGHRIDRFDVPWTLVGAGMLLAVATATAAAWWPARTTARVPITDALSARPPAAKPAHRSRVAAVGFAAAGFVGLSYGIDAKHDHVHPLALLGGVVAIVFAVILIGPFAIRLLAAAGARLPIAARLALRDLSRYRARSASALAAISVGLGIAVTIVVITAGAQNTATEGNLSSRQMLIRVGPSELVPVRSAAQRATQEKAVEHLAGSLGHATLTPIAAISTPGTVLENGQTGYPVAELTRPLNVHSFRGVGQVFVATPAALRLAGADPALIHSTADVLTPERGSVALIGGQGEVFLTNDADSAGRRGTTIRVANIKATNYTSLPRSFVLPGSVHRLGLTSVQYGWIVEGQKAITDAQLTAARDTAAKLGLTIESRDTQHGLSTTRTLATLGGMLLALAVLAMTVGLIRSESGRDLRVLTATGATSATRRTLTAVTAGALAFLGVLLGAIAAYLALVAGYLDKLSPLQHVPVPHLTAMIVGIPLVAAAAGWLLSGREPSTVARPVLD
jgi:putative ABC transport system permease protein